ncbi:MAG: hypothetical protein JO117_00090 [Verrucomicrobia bacterium]|nr:hypothetical protein [Verrucomicrobiota bacterium]
MQKPDFSDCLDEIVARDPRYDKDAYLFVREALDHTLKLQCAARSIRRNSSGSSAAVGRRGTSTAEPMDQHVTGEQLLDGARQFALEQWGPMAGTVLAAWGIQATADIGAIVFNLIAARVFGKNEQDSLADFENVFDFHDAFARPFLPRRLAGETAGSAAGPDVLGTPPSTASA